MNINKMISSVLWAMPFGVGIGVATKNWWIGLAIILAFTAVAYNKKAKQKTGC